MRCSIIFHSVCGNTFLMAHSLHQRLSQQGHSSRILRVHDDDLAKWGDIFPSSRETIKQIEAVPVARPEDMVESEAIFLGSPTYFGNVSSEMKAYMDGASIYWVQASLAGKRLGVFSSCSNPQGGGELCLKAMITFGQHMGMIHIPVPSNLMPDTDISAYGIMSFSGPMGDKRPDKSVLDAVKAYGDLIANG